MEHTCLGPQNFLELNKSRIAASQTTRNVVVMFSKLRRDVERVYHVTGPLKWVQVVAYVYRKIRPMTFPARALNLAADQTRWRAGVIYRPPFLWGPHANQSSSELLLGRFTLLGQTVDLGLPGANGSADIRWWAEGVANHWQKMLHSFDWLGDLPAEDGRRLIAAYCREVILPRKRMPEQPWTTAFRLQSVIRYHAEHGLGQSVARHVARWANLLSLNLEYRLMGNHLLKDAIGLSLAGRFLEGPCADQWRNTGDNLIDILLREQIGDDGGHDELTPMYHSLILYDLLDLLSIVEDSDPLREVLVHSCQRMSTFLVGTTHPDGEIVNLNDSGLGVAPPPAALLAKSVTLGAAPESVKPGIRWYPNFGVAVLERGSWWTIVDAGQPCAPHLAGHGHADTLTIEASVAGQRFLVDTGVSSYEDLRVRSRERGTAAHNTASIGNCNSSDVYGLYRIGRRARVLFTAGSVSTDGPWFMASHDGFTRLPGHPVHSRRIDLRSDYELTIQDRMASRGEQPWRLNWHIAPNWQVEQTSSADGRRLRLHGPDGIVIQADCSHGMFQCDETYVHLRFGCPERTNVIRCHDLPVNAEVTTKFTIAR